MLAMFLALAIQNPAPVHIQDMGWTYASKSDEGDELTMFTRPGPRATTLWVRFESQVERDGARSVAQLNEANCSTGEFRVLQQTAYTEPNLRGRAISKSPSTWVYPTPGSFAETAFKVLCGL